MESFHHEITTCSKPQITICSRPPPQIEWITGQSKIQQVLSYMGEKLPRGTLIRFSQAYLHSRIYKSVQWPHDEEPANEDIPAPSRVKTNWKPTLNYSTHHRHGVTKGLWTRKLQLTFFFTMAQTAYLAWLTSFNTGVVGWCQNTENKLTPP